LGEYWFAGVGGDGGETWEGGAAGGIVPVVWAMTDVDATMAVTLAKAAARRLSIMAAPQLPRQFQNRIQKRFTVSKLKNVKEY
jgi:hypothetical protein